MIQIKEGKMMHMTFYWSVKVTLLFSSWKTNSWLSYALTLLACLIFSIFYQYMEDRRLRFKLLSSKLSSSTTSTIETPLLRSKLRGLFSPGRFVGGVIYGVNSAIGYLLMLAVMSFNGGVLVAIVVGLSVGYWLFRSCDAVDEGTAVAVLDNPCACA